MEAPYNGASGRTSIEATTVWCGGCGIWFGSNVYRSIDAEADSALIGTFLAEGFAGLNTCVCPSCSWRHVAQEPIAIHFPQRGQFLLYVPNSLRHRAQSIRAEFLASVSAAPGVHVPRYVFEPVLVGSRTELRQLVGESRSVSKLASDDYSSIDSDSADSSEEVSVVKRSQTLNLLAELVGEDGDEALIEAELGSAISDRETEPFSLGGIGDTETPTTKNTEVKGTTDDALSTQRELETEKLLGARDVTAELDQFLDDEPSIEEGAEGSSELSSSVSSAAPAVLIADTEQEVSEIDTLSHDEPIDVSNDNDDNEVLSGSASQDDSSSDGDGGVALVVQETEVAQSSDAALSSMSIETNTTSALGDEGNAEDLPNLAGAAVESAREAMISGSVELAADYSRELEAHSRPPQAQDFEVEDKDPIALQTETVTDSNVTVPTSLGGGSEVHIKSPSVDTEEEASLGEDVTGVSIDEQGVLLRLKLTAGQLENLENTEVRVVPQLHELGDHKVCTLTVLGIEDGRTAPYYSPLSGELREAVLEQLSARYSLRLELLATKGQKSVQAQYSYPLETNAAAMQRRLEDCTEAMEQTAAGNLTDQNFEFELSHSFSQESFLTLESASEAALALGIVEFWSHPQRALSLWSKMGFPLEWWDEIQSRVVNSAYEFGLPVSPELTETALSLLDLETESLYVTHLIDHFLEVCLRIRTSGLDIVQIAGVWDQLLAKAQSLNLEVDAEVEALASQAMDEAEMALEDEAGYVDESIEAIEISLADAMEVASIGGVDISNYAVLNRPTSSMVEPSMAEKSSDELVNALGDESHRVAATITLLARRDTDNFQAIQDAINEMTAADLQRVLPSVLPHAEAFVGFFRGGLFADQHAQRLAAAALLVEYRDERVINPLLAMILDPEEEQWSALALFAAQFGTAVGKPALSRVSIDVASSERIAFLLAAIESVAPGTLDALGEQGGPESVLGCLEAARLSGEDFDASFIEQSFEDRVTQLLSL